MIKMRLGKAIATLLIGVTGVTLLSGCSGKSGAAGAADGTGVKIMLSIHDEGDVFLETLSAGVVDGASKFGATVEKVDCGNVIQDQIEQISKAEENGFDAIIARPIDPSTALQMEVAAGDLPIVFVNNMPAENRLEPNQYVFVGPNEAKDGAGQYQAEYVLDKLGNPKTMNVVILQGAKGNPASVDRTEGVRDTLKANGCEAAYVFNDTAEWKDTVAYEKMKIFFKTGQKFDAVFCNNDTMAKGAVMALKEDGYDLSKIPVVGIDASAEGCKMVQSGDMQFTVLQDGVKQGEVAVESAVVLSRGGNLSSVEGCDESGTNVWVPFTKVDKSNVGDYMK